MAVIAVAARGAMFDPGPCLYMDKLAVGPVGVGVVDIDQTPTENLRALAVAKGVSVRDLTAMVLDRDRHADLIGEISAAGARLRLIADNDVSAAVSTALDDSGVDVLFCIGGSPEAVIAAAAIKCMGGQLQTKVWPRSDAERRTALDQGYDPDVVLTADDLVAGDECFFAATGITDGNLLTGVRYAGGTARTYSLVMRARSGTVRRIEAVHTLAKIAQFAAVDY
jgi:fructose-1,6-bisphosphatase II